MTDVKRTLNWRRPIPGEDPAVARLLAMVTALTSELTVTRERVDTLERLIEQAGLFPQAAVEAFEPSPEAGKARDEIRKRQIRRVFRALKDDVEREAGAAAPRDAVD